MVRLPQAVSARLRGGRAFAAVLVAAALAHLPALFNGFVWDDLVFILANPVLRDPGNAAALFISPETWGTGAANPYYRPLTMLAFMGDTLLWGERAIGYHATNLLLHLGACALLLAVLRRLLSPGPALAAALLFAVHPAHAEPVAYVSARGDLLCAVFLLASFLAWIRHVEDGARGALALSALAYGAALFAKISAGLFPAVFLLHAFLFARRRPRARDLLPFAAVALGYLALRGAVLDQGTWGAEPLSVRVATAGPVIARYLLMALSPAHLSVFHDVAPRVAIDALAVVAWAAVAATVALAAASFRRAPRAVLALAWFLAGIIPVSGLVTFVYPALVADRYLYLPLLGGSLAAGAILQRLAAARLALPARRAAAGAFAVALLALASFTAARDRHWRDSITLWERAGLEAPRNQYVLNALGWVYRSTDRLGDAERALRLSLALNEANSDTHLNLAILALVRDDLDLAERHIVRALELSRGSAVAYRYLSVILLAKGNDAVALRAAERAFELNPFDAKAGRLVAGLRRGDGAALLRAD